MTVFIQKDSPFRKPADDLRVEAVFLFQYPCCQAGGGVICADRYTDLQYHRSAIHVLGYKMNTGPVFPAARINNTLVGIQSGEVRQE